MRAFTLVILILATHVGLAQQWEELKHRIQQQQEKDKRTLSRARISWPSQVSDSLNHLLLQAVHPSGNPIYLTTLNANAAATTGTTKLQNGLMGFNLTGNNQHIFQWDGGAVLKHNEFDMRVYANEGTTTDRHATHIAGTLMASGINVAAKGMAPKALLHAYYFDDDIFELATQSEANPFGFLITNHSYGATTGWHRINGNWQWLGDPLVSNNEDYTAGFYSIKTGLIDEIAYNSPYHTIVWAAGNDRADVGTGSHPPDCNGGTGYDCIIQQGTAKNIITVGGVDQVLNYTGPNSVVMPGFSSWGPTDDGRIKPDLVSDGSSVLSTTNASIDQYATLGGTSMATATVSGSLLLLQELYGKLNGNRWMRASTLKALALHTTREAGNAPGPDYSFGWGLIDVAEAARVISKRDDVNTFIIESELPNNATHEWLLPSLANQKITATLVWADPAGLSPGAVLDPPFKMLINDLDLKLFDANGVINYPWVLDPENLAGAASRADNTRDNVEKIELNFPEAKTYRLQLSHKGYLVNDKQAYSLIITYTSNHPSRTLYWIGGNGNWNDGVHWSLSSGGVTANTTPTASDRIIVDENSFSTTGSITLTSSVTCQALRWYCSKPAGINFNGQTITIRKELTLASDDFQKSNKGKFILSSSDTGTVNANHISGSLPDVEFASGAWRVHGVLNLDTLAISGGQVSLEEVIMDVNRFIGLGTASQLDVNNTIITVHTAWQSDATKTAITSVGSSIIMDGSNVAIQASNLNWAGAFINKGHVELSGNISVDSLALEANTTTTIGSGNTLTVNDGLHFDGKIGGPVTLNATGAATLHTAFHQKLCWDFISITNVNVTGDAVINLSANSTVQNASGWMNQDCAEVPFPDFQVNYACANAWAEFVNTSTGNAISYQWNFGDPTSDSNASTEVNPKHQYKQTGQYTVTLTVNDGATSKAYAKAIEIIVNTLPLTSIEYNNEILFSSAESQHYQWFNNEEAISNETSRMFAYGGVQGVYQVVLYDDQCNSPSEPFSISGLSPLGESFFVYPNPANEKIYYTIPNATRVQLFDYFGRAIDVPWHASEAWADVSHVNSGLYLLAVSQGPNQWTKKVVLKR